MLRLEEISHDSRVCSGSESVLTWARTQRRCYTAEQSAATSHASVSLIDCRTDQRVGFLHSVRRPGPRANSNLLEPRATIVVKGAFSHGPCCSRTRVHGQLSASVAAYGSCAGSCLRMTWPTHPCLVFASDHTTSKDSSSRSCAPARASKRCPHVSAELRSPHGRLS